MKKELFLQIVRGKAKAALTPEEEGMFGSIGEAIEKAFEAETVERGKQLTAITEKLGTIDEGESLAGIIRSLATQIEAVEAASKKTLSQDDKYLLKRALKAKETEIMAAKRGSNPWSLEFKAKRAASALMTTGTVMTGAVAYQTDNLFDDMEVIVIKYPKNFILDAISSRNVANIEYAWRWKEEITAGVGVPTVVAEGTVKPLVDKKFTWKYADRVKYAGRMEYTEEVTMDFDALLIDIINMFEQDVLRAWQNAVLAAVIAYAPAYTTTALDGKIVKPTVYSVIGAGKLHVENNNYEPDVVIMNPGDAAEAIYLQDANGAQQFIPSDLQFGGLQPFMSNGVAVGTILVGTRNTIQERHSNYIVRSGQYGDQLIENEYTIIGEVFSKLKLPTLSQYSWVKLDVDTVKGLLLKPTGN